MNYTNAFSALVIALIVLCSVAANGQVTVIKAGKLVDPASGTVSINQVIIVEAGKIKAVGANLEIPPSATFIDLSKSTVLPGLFDCPTPQSADFS